MFEAAELTAIGVGGAVGAIARVGLIQVLPAAGGGWPWATFAANVIGTAMLGYFVTRLQERLPVSTLRRPLLGTGLCGALTTFSTIQVELLRMIDRHDYLLAATYAAGSLATGYLALLIATVTVRRVRTVL